MIRRCLTPAIWLALVGCLCAAMAHPSTDDLYAQEDVLSAEQRQWLADQNTAIRIGVTAIPPQVFVDSRTGQLVGLCIDFIQEMERILGYRFEVVFFDTWNAMMEAAFLRDIDVVYAAQRTPSREAAFLFTDSYLIFENKIVTTIDIDGPLTMADLKDKTVTVVRGAAIEEHLTLNYPAIQLMPVDDELIGLTRVSFNQVDAMVVEIARASWYIQQKKITNLHIAGDAGYIYELGFACRNDRPELRDILNAGLIAIGPARRTELMRRWILPSDTDKPDLLIWLFIAGGLAAALLAVFGWNRLLSLQVRQRTAELEQELDAHEKDLAALKRYETAMQRLFGNLRGIAYRCRYERDWPMEFISAGCEEMTGYSDQAFYDGTASWGDLILEEDRDYAWDEITRRLEKKETFQVEYRIRDHSGQIKWFWEKGCGVYDPTGQVVSLEGFITDITDRKTAEKAMQDSENRYRELIDLAVDGVLLGDHEGRILEANSFMLNLTGKTRDDLVGRNIAVLFEPEVLKQTPLRFDLLRRGQVVVSERAIRRTDGATMLVEMRTKMMPDGSYQSILRDITNRKQAEEIAALNSRRTRSLLQLNQMTDATISQIADFALEEAILLTGSTIGYLAFLNEDESVLKMFSWSKSAMAECAINEKPITYLVRNTGLWGEAVRQRRPIITNDYAAENPWKKGIPAGHIAMTRHMNVPVFSGDRMVLVAGVGNKELPYEQEDIQQLTLFMEGLWRLVERKHSEQVREDLLKELGRKNEELESIVFIASHDLRGPLVNIRGFAGELNKSIEQIQEVVNNAGLHDELLTKLAMPLERDIPESLQFIDASSQKMEMLLNGLLRLSRIGTAQINPTAINMEQLIGGIIGVLEFKIRQNNIDIAVEGSLPPCRGDLTLINQVFSNLVDNAVKYRHPERPCRIRIRGRAENGRSLYEVEDNGIGIAAEHQQKIFEMFYQLKPGSGGDGLGLTIVRRVLERQDGTINILSDVGVKTTVVVTLPSE